MVLSTVCPMCHHRLVFYSYEKEDVLSCTFCGHQWLYTEPFSSAELPALVSHKKAEPSEDDWIAS